MHMCACGMAVPVARFSAACLASSRRRCLRCDCPPPTHPLTRLVPVPPAAQGWRLDPLLLFGQLMTTGAAVSFAIEALRLRSEMYESEVGWI